MKIRFTLLAALAGLLTFTAGAQDETRRPGGPGAPGGPGGRGEGRARFQPSAEEIKKYDKDADGQLSREEMRTMFEERRKELEKKYDANGDGKLDEEERKKLEAENPRRGPGGPGGAGAPGGPGGFPPPSAEEIKTYDKNGDGKLEGEEATALRQARQKARMEKYDTDKNGELSDEERAKMMEDMRRERGGRTRPEGRGRGNSAPSDAKPDAPKIPVPESK